MSDDCIDNVGITNDVSDVEIVEDTLSEITVTEEAVTIVASCDEIIVSPSPDELFYVDVTDETVEINITEDAVTITTDCAQGIPGAPGVASWDNTFSYSIDDVIYYDGNFYVSLTSNTNSQPDTNPSDWTQITTSGGGGAVDSVNAYTGTVVLDPDDLDDTSTTNKFTNATDISRLANTSGTNTGDQDLSSYLTAVDVDGFYRSNHIEVISTDTTLTDAGTYLIFNVGAPAHLQLTLPDPSTMEGEEVFIVNTPFGFVDVIGPIDGGAGAILPLNTFIAYRAVQLPPAFGGTWLWGSAQRAGVPYDLPDWYNFATGASGVPVDYAVTMNDPGDGIVRPIWKDISPPVDSVNGQTDVVVLDWTDVGADQAGSAGQALIDANNYTDTEIGALNFLTEAQADLLYRSDYVEVVTTHKTITQPGTYLIFNTLAPTHLDITLPDPEDFPGAEIFLLNAPFGSIDIDGTVDGQTTTIYPSNSFIGLRSFQLPVLFGGTWLWGSAQRAGIPFDLPAWWDSVNGVAAIPEGHILKIVNDIISGVDIPTWVAPPAEIPDGTMVNDILVWNGTEYEAEQLNVEPPKTTTLFDKATTNIIYIGKAPIGTSTGSAAWLIKKVDKTVTDNVTITFAAAGAFTATWNNRGSETYS